MGGPWSPDQRERDMIVSLLALPDPVPVLARAPATLFTAADGDAIVGFAAHSGNRPGIVGPLGVHPDHRWRGIGAALLYQCLLDLRAAGYVYAIIGQVGPAAFYEKTCGALLLPAEWPHSGTP